MTFRQVPSPVVVTGPDVVRESKTQNPLWELFQAVRDARCLLGLRSGHLQTLQAMLSFLKPGQGLVVFASNIELCRRAGGVDERTVRRHLNRFEEIGFLSRQDSPNRKRYRVRSPEGETLSFGLSLEPLLALRDQIVALAHQAEEERRRCRFLRKKILSHLAALEEIQDCTYDTEDTRRILRRKMSANDYQTLLDGLPALPKQEQISHPEQPETPILSANDGQNVRHHSKSEKEIIDSEKASPAVTPDALMKICSEAQSFSAEPIRDWQTIEQHAWFLAPMMGIDNAMMSAATKKMGLRNVAVTLFILLQKSAKIRSLPAYFRSITLGSKADSFCPQKLLSRLEDRTTAGIKV
ncbi:plasmid replication protein RepC [Mameliella sediminis]|uniref:plasmid replication protein RepC n=1 Tax=Mameliella sediminis TaxID=2836866 RepID=UPI001C468F5C|nr:plasmid replication protein RepC [Mameliella sediminis]MBV7395854.1 replication initiator RepC [Mameliella sediminis]